MKKKVLICEDDEGIVEVLRMVLEDKEYEVILCQDTDPIMETVIVIKPDLILLDLWMPGKNGEQIAVELKGDFRTKSIPIIIISASKDTQKVALDSGADDFICKPFDIAEIEKKAKKYLR